MADTPKLYYDIENGFRTARLNKNYYQLYADRLGRRVGIVKWLVPVLSVAAAFAAGAAAFADATWWISFGLSLAATAVSGFEAALGLRERLTRAETLKRRWTELEGEWDLLYKRALERLEGITRDEYELLHRRSHRLQEDELARAKWLVDRALDQTYGEFGLDHGEKKQLPSARGRREEASSETGP